MAVTNREKIIIDLLFELSNDMEKVGNAKHAAAVVKKGVIYSIGVNSEKSDPMQYRFSNDDNKTARHAEMVAIKRALAKLRVKTLEGYTLFVIRSKGDGKGGCMYGNSRPCEACQTAIDTYGIDKLVYSVDGGYKVEKLYREHK